MPNMAGISRRVRPSRSLYCACKYFTTAWAVVRRTVSGPGEGFMGNLRQVFGSSDAGSVQCDRASVAAVAAADLHRREEEVGSSRHPRKVGQVLHANHAAAAECPVGHERPLGLDAA